METAVIIAIVSLIGTVITGSFQLLKGLKRSSCTSNGCVFVRENNDPEIEIEMSSGRVKNISIDRNE